MIETYVGFDSAWTDHARAPGAICAVQLRPGMPPLFQAPQLSRFAEALAFIDTVSSGSDYTLIALDQPTIVPNQASMRPAERVAASVISWIGGGVQPANRSRIGMFCPASPIWPFLEDLAATENPMAARTATSGRHLMEVFPALALASLEPAFFRRLGAPRYNPANTRRFRLEDWQRVCIAACHSFQRHGLDEPAAWSRAAAALETPGKADQDRLDAMLCLAVALHWRRAPAGKSIMIGDLTSGYIVAPASGEVRERLAKAASERGVPIDGVPATSLRQ